MDKKRHHYIPRAYLKFFCDKQGKVRVYLKDAPDKSIHQTPNNTGFHKYYYSQPLAEGKKDHNKLEDVFSKFEAKWPPIVERLQRREDISDSLEDIFCFMALQRLRVPATRDTCEKMLSERIKIMMRRLDAEGKLPPKPAGFEDILDHTEVPINPHQSIHAMVQMLPGVFQVLDQIGIGVLYNRTDIPFLTSDNPVIWFDASVPEDEMQPYVLQPDSPIVLLFPIAPNLIIFGDSSMRERFAHDGFGYGELSKRKHVKMMNRQICRFAYKAVFAQKPGQEALIRKYADISPVLRFGTDTKGKLVFFQNVFGKREQKPEWMD